MALRKAVDREDLIAAVRAKLERIDKERREACATLDKVPFGATDRYGLEKTANYKAGYCDGLSDVLTTLRNI